MSAPTPPSPGEPRPRPERDRLEHDLATARAYQATYAGLPEHWDLYVRRQRANNVDEIARLEAALEDMDR